MAETSVTLAEETALRVRQLEVRFDDFETETKMSDCYLSELDEELEEGRVNLEKLEKRVTQLEADLTSETQLFEERVETLKIQNEELRIHLNLVVEMVNSITRVWNETFNNNNESVDEVIDNTRVDNERPDEVIAVDDEPAQLTLQQVYDMYQSQPPDEEGWREMTKAIEAAEQYEASLQKQQELPTRVNGLTQDEWNDLLRI